MSKLDNLPPVYWLTLADQPERHKCITDQFAKYGITDHTRINGYDGRVTDYHRQPDVVNGIYFDIMKSTDIACAMGHLSMIKHWYDNSTSDVGLFLKDDVNLENCEHWNFTWSEFFASLPSDWKNVQLAQIRADEISDVGFRPRIASDWCVTAYLIKRSYAKQLIDDYFIDGRFRLIVQNDKQCQPIVENFVYFPGEPKSYTIPLFTEKNTFSLTFYSNDTKKVKEYNALSEKYVTTWWQQNGPTASLESIMTKPVPAPIIPMIGTAVVTNIKWVKRLVESVDFPVKEFCIINNNGRGEIDEELDAIAATPHSYIRKIKVVHMPANLGVPGSWNLMIKSYLKAPYWIIVNDDVAFGRGFLAEMYAATMCDPSLGIIHGHEGDHNVGSWDLFLLRDHIVADYGLFDENLYPAYNEDADYFLRFIHSPIRKMMNLRSDYYHGEGKKNEYHVHGSQTGKSDPVLKEKLDRVNLINMDYMTHKWGKEWRWCAPSKLPFENRPISYTSYDLRFIRQKYLGF